MGSGSSPIQESLRKSGNWQVMAVSMDVCLTPMGSAVVPVPYQVVAFGAEIEEVATTVNMTAEQACHRNSYIPSVKGDEAGSSGGIISGVNKGCAYPLTWSSDVRVQGEWLIRHNDWFAMNAASPAAIPNCFGKAVWTESQDEGAGIDDVEEGYWNDPDGKSGKSGQDSNSPSSESQGGSPQQSGGTESEGSPDEQSSAPSDGSGSREPWDEKLPDAPVSNAPSPSDSFFDRIMREVKDEYNEYKRQENEAFQKFMDQWKHLPDEWRDWRKLMTGDKKFADQPPGEFLWELGKATLHSAWEVAKAVFNVAVGLVTHPIDTIMGLGLGVARLPSAILGSLSNFRKALEEGNLGKAIGDLAGDALAGLGLEAIGKKIGFKSPKETAEEARHREHEAREKQAQSEKELKDLKSRGSNRVTKKLTRKKRKELRAKAQEEFKREHPDVEKETSAKQDEAEQQKHQANEASKAREKAEEKDTKLNDLVHHAADPDKMLPKEPEPTPTPSKPPTFGGSEPGPYSAPGGPDQQSPLPIQGPKIQGAPQPTPPQCFRGDVFVSTPSGLKEIRYLNIGDQVFCMDEVGRVQSRRIQRVFGGHVREFIKLATQGETVFTTSTHHFFIKGKGWLPAKHLTPGLELKTKDSKFIIIESIILAAENIRVYNLEIEEHHNFFVGVDSVLVHNMESSPRGPRKGPL